MRDRVLLNSYIFYHDGDLLGYHELINIECHLLEVIMSNGMFENVPLLRNNYVVIGSEW